MGKLIPPPTKKIKNLPTTTNPSLPRELRAIQKEETQPCGPSSSQRPILAQGTGWRVGLAWGRKGRDKGNLPRVNKLPARRCHPTPLINHGALEPRRVTAGKDASQHWNRSWILIFFGRGSVDWTSLQCHVMNSSLTEFESRKKPKFSLLVKVHSHHILSNGIIELVSHCILSYCIIILSYCVTSYCSISYDIVSSYRMVLNHSIVLHDNCIILFSILHTFCNVSYPITFHPFLSSICQFIHWSIGFAQAV